MFEIFDFKMFIHLQADEYSTLETSSNESENLSKLRDSSNSAVVISKLNPNVPEFVPTSSKTLLTAHKNNNLSLNNNMKTEKDISVTSIKNSNKTNDLSTFSNVIKSDNSNGKADCDSNIIDINKRLDVSKLEDYEKEKLRENLKSKISSTSNTSCVKVKRQRNLAIATLMKLCSQPVTSTQQQETKVLKLMTPQDFENPKCDTKQEETAESNIVPKKDELISQEVVKQSVEKVNKWLKGPEEKTKSQTLFLGPITYKKKEIIKSSASPTTTESSVSYHTNDSISDYKPSKYATELSEKYKKRSKLQEDVTDIWTKLERDLKAKDEIIKKQNTSASTVSDSET